MISKDFETVIDTTKSKKDMQLLRNIYSYGWAEMSRAQEALLPRLFSGEEYDDVAFQFPSGMGKSGVYILTLLHSINYNIPNIQALILLPTHELAIQVYNDCLFLSHNMGINVVKCIGREEMNKPDTRLPTIVIGTLGKVINILCERHGSPLKQNIDLKFLVFDEADNFLSSRNRNGLADIEKVMRSVCQETTHVFTISATFNTHVRDFIRAKLMRKNGKNIEQYIDDQDVTLAGIRQEFIDVFKSTQNDRFDMRVDLLVDLIPMIGINKAIIFVNSSNRVQYVYNKLVENNYQCLALYGSLEQNQRNMIMNEFRNTSKNFLIATDLVARGIDFKDIACVIQLELPVEEEDYIHRIGRSGRYGKVGRAIVFLARNDFESFDFLVQKYGIKAYEYTIDA